MYCRGASISRDCHPCHHLRPPLNSVVVGIGDDDPKATSCRQAATPQTKGREKTVALLEVSDAWGCQGPQKALPFEQTEYDFYHPASLCVTAVGVLTVLQKSRPWLVLRPLRQSAEKWWCNPGAWGIG